LITINGPLWLWNAEKGSWHFVTVPDSEAAEIRALSFAGGGGFGSVRVEALVGDIRWRTSLFPVKRTGEYLLPVKADVRRRAGISAGHQVTVVLELL
jgi:hypothetical protein